MMKSKIVLTTVAGSMLACVASAGALGQAHVMKMSATRIVPPANGMLIRESSPGGTSDSKTLTLTLPPDTNIGTLKARLNGKDVSSQFSQTSCANAICETATFTANDGLNSGKNVLAVEVKSNDGKPLTSRLRFAATPASTGFSRVRPALAGQTTLKAQAQALGASLPTASNFLPPTISLQTRYTGGPNGSDPWIQIGSQPAGRRPSSYVGCSGSPVYFVIDLDRQNLQERTPTSAGQCIADGATLASYLSSLQQGDLVILGTWVYQNADPELNTTAIGGTDYTTSARQSSDATGLYPRGYMAIGVVGASAGEAYENFYTDISNANQEDALPFANGMLVEDPNGSYNFQATNGSPYEYVVVPTDPTVVGNGLTFYRATIRIGKVNPDGTKSFNVYYSNNDSSDAARTWGVWMMVFNRDNMSPYDPSGTCKAGTGYSPLNPGDTAYVGCGTFYPVLQDPADSWNALANDLSAVPEHKLVILTTANCCDAADLTPSIGPALDSYGAASYALQTPNGNFSLVSSNDTALLKGVGITPQGADYDFTTTLNGNAVFSVAAYSAQGQSGYLRGTLVPDHYGEYAPTISNQEDSSVSSETSAMDLGMHEVYYSTPVDWPELTTLLPGASNLQNQQGAYAYLSYDLLTNHYMPGVTGGNEDDIHYYFTGGLNTLLNYYNYNPMDEQWPGGNGYFSWVDPVLSTPDNQVGVSFTQGDFLAVRAQLSQEIQYLTNTLTMMVTGSTNLKNIVAGGQSSVALAMIGAASSIYKGTLNPPPTTPATANVSNILNFLGGVVGVGVTVATDGLVPPELVSDATKWGGIVSGSLWAAGSVGFVNPGTTRPNTDIPNPNERFLTNIADIASSELQGQMGQNFDAMLDSILSDWGRLSFVGPKVMDTGSTGWYLPRQSVQSGLLSAMNNAAQSSIYLSILPSFYVMDGWYGDYTWFGGGAPDIGFEANGIIDDKVCNPIYPNPMAPFVAMGYFTNGGYSVGPPYDAAHQQQDLFVIAGAVSYPGTSNFSEAVAPESVPQYLFGTLNLPVPSFFAVNGPLPIRRGPTFTKWSYFCGMTSGIRGIDYSSAYPPSTGVGAAPGVGPVATSTTLTGPDSSVVGSTITLTAKATAASGSVAGQTITFFDDKSAVGSASVKDDGSASVQLTGLTVGTHQFTAGLVASGALLASISTPLTHTVYAHPSDISVQLSANTLSVSYSGQSSAVTLQVQSLYGLSGAVTFSCSGLPVGMTCNFTPPSATLAANGNVSTSFIIGSSSTSKASAGGAPKIFARPPALSLLSGGTLALLFLPLVWGPRRRAMKYLGMLVLLAGTFMVGCGGSKTISNRSIQETGTKTLLISATIGNTTRTVPLVVNIQ